MIKKNRNNPLRARPQSPFERILKQPLHKEEPVRTFPWKTASRVILIATILGTAFVVAKMPAWWSHRAILATWGKEWDRLPEARLKDRCDQISAMEEEGIPELAKALGHQRDEVAIAAVNAIFDATQRWRAQPTDIAAWRASLLTKELIKNVDSISPAAIEKTQRIARRLVAWPMGWNGAKNRRGRESFVLEREELVVRLRQRAEDVAAELVAYQTTAFPNESETPDEMANSSRTLSQPSFTISRPSDLRMDTPLAPTPTADEYSEPAEIVDEPPKEINPPTISTPVPPTKPSTPPVDELTEEPVDEMPQPIATRREVGSLASRSPRDLLRIMQLGDEQISERVIAEFRRRGFSPLQIQVAKLATDPNEGVRLRLLSELPRMRLDARPWIVWLASDPDPRVRAAAANVIATSTDSDLREQLENAINDEPDLSTLREVQRAKRMR